MLTEEQIQYQDDFFLRKASTWRILGYHALRVSPKKGPLGGQSTTRSSWSLKPKPPIPMPFFKEKEKDLGQRVTSESLPVWVLEQHKLPLRPDFFIYVISWNRLWLNPSGSAGVLLYGGKRKAYWLWNLKVEIRTWLAPWVGWSLPGSPAFLPFQSPTSFSTPLSFASDPTSSHFAFPPMQKMESLRPE